MRLFFQFISFSLLSMSALHAGFLSLMSPDEVLIQYFGTSIDIESIDQEIRYAIDSHIRFLSGIWIAAGLAVLFCLKHFEKHAAVFRLVSFGLILGGCGEFFTAVALSKSFVTPLMKGLLLAVMCGGVELWRTKLAYKLKHSED